MINLLLTGFLSLVNVNAIVINSVQLFITTAYTALAFIGLIQMIAGIRSGRVIA